MYICTSTSTHIPVHVHTHVACALVYICMYCIPWHLTRGAGARALPRGAGGAAAVLRAARRRLAAQRPRGQRHVERRRVHGALRGGGLGCV